MMKDGYEDEATKKNKTKLLINTQPPIFIL